MENKILNVKEPEKVTPVKMSVDVLVVGGGPAGIMAALAAAEDGMKVVLVESRSFLGGNLTIGLPILDFLGQKGNQIISGLPQRFIDRLATRGGASKHVPCPLHMSVTYIEPEEVKAVAFDMLKEKGVNVLLYTLCAGVVMEENRLQGIIVESKTGREAILAKVIIDCTGDADVAFRAGVPCEYGDENRGVQPPTLMFSMDHVAVRKLSTALSEDGQNYAADYIPAEYYKKNPDLFILVGLRSVMQKARENGMILPVERTIIITGLKKDEVWINMTRVSGVDGTDPGSLTNGEYVARQQIHDLIKYLTEYVPGFEDARFSRMAPFLGIRETRRIVGKYVMTRDDVLSCRRFEDAIAMASYPIDLHHPVGGGCTLEWCGDSYDIPYRSLIPLDVENLIVAGRSISTTHEALSAIRVMAPCMAMGEAAGRAAGIAVKDGVLPSGIDVQKLKAGLLSGGALLDSDRQ